MDENTGGGGSGAAACAVPCPYAYVRLPALCLTSPWMIEDALLGACMDIMRVTGLFDDVLHLCHNRALYIELKALSQHELCQNQDSTALHGKWARNEPVIDGCPS